MSPHSDHRLYRLYGTLVSLCLLGSSSLWAKDGDEQSTLKDQAADTYAAIRDRFAGADAVSQNLSSPLLSGTAFTTLDGRQRFNQQISCPGSSYYLEVFFALGSGGDLSPVRLKQDTDFDGTYDASYSVPVPVSGVCANGIISCELGTFNGCRSYAWSSSSAGLVTLTDTSLSALAGCYCLNASCGNGLGFTNRSSILDDLAGGVAGALMQRDPRYAVSSVEKEDFMIRLAGQDMAACAEPVSRPGHAYADNPAEISSDAFAAAASDPVFSLLENIPSEGVDGFQRNMCRIERQVTLREILRPDIIGSSAAAPYAEDSCAGETDCFTFRLGDGEDDNIRVSGGCHYFTREVTWAVGHLDRIREATLLDALYEDQIAVSVNGELVFSTGGFDGVNRPGDCQINDQHSVSIMKDITGHLKEGLNQIKMVVAVKSKGSALLRGRVRYRSGCDLLEDIQNTCAPYSENDACAFLEETVDGVDTFKNRGRTGLTPLPETRTLYGAECSRSFTKPWFVRERTYECEIGDEGGLTFDFTRASHIYSGSTVDQVADIQLGEDGSKVALTRGYAFDSDYGVSECQQICKTRVSVTDSEVSSSGVVGDLLTDPEAGHFTYHHCAAGLCPAGPGETIVSECGCLNEFPQALALMQSMRLAGQDLICTTGTKQPL
ncbi:hypothetical protein [Kordiimonas pumila]|uniref:Conjugal transfer protein TraN n=1 Tax=Kordiimonas pumila TaxID=2161677 RepID=A0ABV7D5A3_9PROT|nr:hypothetical protein [Kordiimonas pumila]